MRRSKAIKFTEVFDLLKHRIVNNNLSIKEVADNSGVSEKLVEILLNPDSDVIDSISRLLTDFKINTYAKELTFRVYEVYGKENQFKVTRLIKPRCSIYFDKSTQKYYKFSVKYKRDDVSETNKQLIMSEMKEFLENYVNKLQENL